MSVLLRAIISFAVLPACLSVGGLSAPVSAQNHAQVHVQAATSQTAASTFITIKPSLIDDLTEISGQVEGTEMAEARARINGTLEEVKVGRGDWVKKGQVLGIVRDKKFSQQSAALKTQVDVAQKNLDRLQKLLPVGAVSPIQVEQAQAQLAALQAQLQNTGQNTADGRILAPFDGQFITLRAVSGTVLMSGESMGTVAARPLQVKLSLPQRHAHSLNVGDTIPLLADATNNAPGAATGSLGQGQVARIYPQVTNGRVLVDVSLPDAATSLMVGQKVLAQVATGQRQGILVPANAVSVRNNLSYVRLKNGADVLVQTGYPRADGSIEILSGLQSGDIVNIR